MDLGWSVYGVLVLVLVGCLSAYASWTAGRIDRLHHRVAAARAALDAELAARAALVQEYAGSGALDPASALLLVDAAYRARSARAGERELSESALTRALDVTLADDVPDPWRGDLAVAARRVQLARRFHNDIVVSARSLRRRRLVRWLRLSGRAQLPETVEFDDGG